MNDSARLPPGQFELSDFPRFGLGRFANRFPDDPAAIRIAVRGDVERTLLVTTAVQELPRCEQVADFHCVTTWSCRNLHWGGFRFADFYHQIVAAEARPHEDASLVVFRAGDGYCTSLPLADVLARDVMLADRLHGQALDLEHGAPLRLVAPAHYGYKNVKHLAAIEFWRDRRAYRFPRPTRASWIIHAPGSRSKSAAPACRHGCCACSTSR